MPEGATLRGNGEYFYVSKFKDPTVQNVAMFLRHPIKHIYSQFLECKYDSWGRRVTNQTEFPRRNMSMPYDGFEQWIDHFLGQPRLKEKLKSPKNFSSFAFNCYNPWNMQSRYLASPLYHARGPHFACAWHLVPNADVASLNLAKVNFIGLVDFFQESLCVFRFMAGAGIEKDRCSCGGPGPLRNATRVTHGVPKHSLQDLSPEVTAKAARMAQADLKAALQAVERFQSQLSRVRKATGVRIICDDRLGRFRDELRGYMRT